MSKKKEKESETMTERAEPDDSGESPDIVIPVCLGEFGIEEARGFRRLWESIWPQDKRGKVGKI